MIASLSNVTSYTATEDCWVANIYLRRSFDNSYVYIDDYSHKVTFANRVDYPDYPYIPLCKGQKIMVSYAMDATVYGVKQSS